MMIRTMYWTVFSFLTCFTLKSVLSDQRCHKAPNWLVNGRNPIIENAAEGNVVVLSLVSSKSRKFLLHTLDALNNYGRHYSYVVQQKVKILVMNGQGEKLPDNLIDYFQYIKIYDEPQNAGLFKKLRGRAWDVLVYDICGRMQFHYVYPYSWLGFPFLSRAINYAVGKYTHVCGYCTPLSAYRHLPAKIPPTLSSSHIPAEVVTIPSGIGMPVAVNRSTAYRAKKVDKSFKTEDEAVGRDRKTAVIETYKASVRAHHSPILEGDTKYKKGMKSGNMATVITSTNSRQTTEEIEGNNDVRKYIVSRLDEYLKKRHSTNKPKTEKGSSDEITVADRSKSRNSKQEIQKKIPTRKSTETPTTQTGNRFTTNPLQVTDALLQTRDTPITTAVPSTKKEGTTKNLNKAITEENKKLHEQIEKVQKIIEPITESMVHKKQDNEKTQVSGWENNLLLDYLLQRSVFRKK